MSFYSPDSNGQLWRVDVNTDGSLQTTAVSSGPTTGTSVSAPTLTGGTLVRDALLEHGVIQSSDTIGSADMVDCLRRLNYLLDAWNAEGLMVPSVGREELLLTSGHNPHTIGVGADLNTTRPRSIGLAYLKLSTGYEVPLQVLTKEQYAAIPLKTTQGQPTSIYYDTDYSYGNVYLYPVPDQAYTLVSYDPRMLAQVDQNTSFSLPPSYAMALMSNLALRCASMYGKGSSKSAGTIAILASEDKARVKRLNHKSFDMRTDDSLLNCNTFDIRTGRYR